MKFASKWRAAWKLCGFFRVVSLMAIWLIWLMESIDYNVQLKQSSWYQNRTAQHLEKQDATDMLCVSFEYARKVENNLRFHWRLNEMKMICENTGTKLTRWCPCEIPRNRWLTANHLCFVHRSASMGSIGWDFVLNPRKMLPNTISGRWKTIN